jgi:hypothetical protein
MDQLGYWDTGARGRRVHVPLCTMQLPSPFRFEQHRRLGASVLTIHSQHLESREQKWVTRRKRQNTMKNFDEKSVKMIFFFLPKI